MSDTFPLCAPISDILRLLADFCPCPESVMSHCNRSSGLTFGPAKFEEAFCREGVELTGVSADDGTKRASSLSSISSRVNRGIFDDSDEVPWTPST